MKGMSRSRIFSSREKMWRHPLEMYLLVSQWTDPPTPLKERCLFNQPEHLPVSAGLGDSLHFCITGRAKMSEKLRRVSCRVPRRPPSFLMRQAA